MMENMQDRIIFKFDIEPFAKQSARFASITDDTPGTYGSTITSSQYKSMMVGRSKKPNVRSFQDKSIKKKEEILALMAKQQMKEQAAEEMLTGGLHCRVLYYFKVPHGFPKYVKRDISLGHKVYKITKPDLTDNVNKGLMDSLQGIVFENDSQICSFRAEKLYGLMSRIEVEFRRVDNYFKK